MNTKQKRARRERLFKINPHCHHCGCKLVLPIGEPHKTEPDNSATLEHIRTRLNPLRREPNDGISTRTVLSCWKCCNKGATDEQKGLPKEELWKRSGRQPQNKNSKSFPLDAPVKAANDGEWHYCEYCGAYTNMPDESCYRKPNRLSV